jgi:hypothetical protein
VKYLAYFSCTLLFFFFAFFSGTFLFYLCVLIKSHFLVFIRFNFVYFLALLQFTILGFPFVFLFSFPFDFCFCSFPFLNFSIMRLITLSVKSSALIMNAQALATKKNH